MALREPGAANILIVATEMGFHGARPTNAMEGGTAFSLLCKVGCVKNLRSRVYRTCCSARTLSRR